MKKSYLITILIGFFSLIFGFMFLFIGNQQFFKNVRYKIQEHLPGGMKTEQQAMDQLLAEDLSMTTEMFLSQLSMQLKRWAQQDLSTPELKKRFSEELSEHPHFESFAVVHNGQITESYPDQQITEEKIAKLRHKSKDAIFSDPYSSDNNQYFLIGETIDNGKTVVGEVNLSFVKHFIKDMAAVADANGNFFVSGDDPNIQWKTTDEVPNNTTSKTVPKLGWKIVVQSDEKNKKERPYKEHQAVIKLRENSEINDWLTNHQEDIQLIKDTNPYFIIESKNHSTKSLLKLLKKDPDIEFAEPNYILAKQATVTLPNDEFYSPYQWNLEEIEIEEGWKYTDGAKDVVIAVIDTGVDKNHQDLKGKVLEGYNAFDKSSDVTDTHGHGTHVAGIAAATTNNVKGIAGIAQRNYILPVKVLDENGEGSSFEVAQGIRWATDHGASVINMSLGDYENSKVLKDAIKYAYSKDVVLIAASGNDNVGDPMYPANYKEVLTVGAVNENREHAFFSNYGKHLDVAAPGEHIPSTFPNNNYVIMSGTSMAAPHVSGLAGLIRSVNPNLTNKEVYAIIRNTAVDLGKKGRDNYFGYGEINIKEALKAALQK